MFTNIRVATISMKPEKWNKEKNADRLEDFFRKAAKKKVDVAVAPEGILEGYVVMDIIENPKKEKQMLEIAEPIDGPYIKRFQSLARELKTCLCFGFAERLRDGAYNCALFLDQRGRICGKYHKVQLAEGYHDSWEFNRIGRKLRAFETPFGRAGFVICNDRWNPLITRTLVLDGAQVIYILSFGSRSRSQNEAVIARARENGVPIVEANVGVNLVVSKGEPVAYKWGCDQLTVAEIEIPTPPSANAARKSERDYLIEQKREMPKRYRATMKKHRKARSR